MLNYEDRIKMYKGKKLFTEHISKVFEDATLYSNVKKVEYEVYSKFVDEVTTYYTEFIIVTYESGAFAVRNVSGNSNNAIFKSVGQLIDGGYYDEINFYNSIITSNERVNLEDK